MFFAWTITSLLHIPIACAAHHNHRHRALAQRSVSTSVTAATAAISTNLGSSVPIDVGSDGSVGIIEIGSPGQTIDVQFDTTFDGVLVQSSYEYPTEKSGSLVYDCSDSTSCKTSFPYVLGALIEPTYTQTFEDDAYAVAIASTETFNIGGKLYSNIPFGQLSRYDQNASGRATPFGGASGIIGLNYNSVQQSDSPSFMFAIQDQLIEWKCTLDSYREWQNGTWTFGYLESLDNRADIAWARRNVNRPVWSINITAISAGSRKDPLLTTWSATIATESQSFIWPQKLLDWYFTSVDATWSVFDNTYRYPCNASLPDFTFGIGNGTFIVPGTYLPYQCDQSGTTCISIITGDNSTDLNHEYTFGSWWSQLGVLILDYEDMQVGFMNKSIPLPKYPTAALDIIVMN